MPRRPPVIQYRQLKIPLEKLELKERLSRGGRFGSVYKAVCTNSAIQEVLVKKMYGPVRSDLVYTQAEACHSLQNQGIVHFLGFCEATKTMPTLLIWEYMPGGNLRDTLIQQSTFLEYARLQRWLHQVKIFFSSSFISHLSCSLDPDVFLGVEHTEMAHKIRKRNGAFSFSVASDLCLGSH